MDLNERVDSAFRIYAATLDGSFPSGGIAAAHAAYAREVVAVFSSPDLARRACELSVGYVRAADGLPPTSGGAPRYAALVQAAIDVSVGQRRVAETYQALVSATVKAVGDGEPATAKRVGDGEPATAKRVDAEAGALDRAFSAYVAEIRQAWSEADPAGLTPTAVVAAGQSVLAASGLHCLAMEASRPADGDR
ncbi:MAG: hypothetical protein ACRD1K_12540 [Acidimicrobiales bacterium]